MSNQKLVYFFAANEAEGKKEMKNLLGGKGANLAEMCNIGVPVPPGFTITTDVCTLFYKNNKQYPADLEKQVNDTLAKVEIAMDKKFGDPSNPLLLSVRSGARVSMPGMMDTVLNLGLNDQIVAGLAKLSGNERFAWDSYRRFIQMYGDVVMGMKPEEKDDEDPFEAILEKVKSDKGVELDTQLTTDDLKELVVKFKKAIKENTGKDFPEDPKAQLWGAVSAVFLSWDNDRAIRYRKLNNISAEWGTAVNVQSMVYGNMGDDSGTGVAFTRDPSTGENFFYGEYLINAQGEDVVAGIRTPQPINEAGKKNDEDVTLEQVMPEIYKQLADIRSKLENHYKDMQDIEFTIERGKLWMLQTRTGKRTAAAALRTAVEMVEEGFIKKEEALMRVEPKQLDQLLHPTFDPEADKKVLTKGLPASPGAATGKVVFNAEDAEEWAEKGEPIILVRIETSPEDFGGMVVANGIVTARGGMTSHAAVVARGMGKCCVAGCKELEINYGQKEVVIKGTVIKEGEYLSLDGSTGEVMLGEVPTQEPKLSGNFAKLMDWAEEVKTLEVRTNADNPEDSAKAKEFGAKGIGLCRTEHMFFEGDRITAVREMILAKDLDGRKVALAKLLPYQKADFKGIYKAMGELPVTVRLLDPPLHEFLPPIIELREEIADLEFEMQADAETRKEQKEFRAKIEEKEALLEIVESLHELNPMLGHRGCRLGITYPEITEMQTRAIIEAAIEVQKEQNIKIKPEIMVPLVGNVKELANQKAIIKKTADKIIDHQGVELEYMIGTMIEVPRAAVTADKIAEEAEFFSFGTNDLTQMGCGFSRDDAGKFLTEYNELGIYDNDPFAVLDQEGVGELVKLAVERGRKTNPNIKLGICGEHGGEPSSIDFCHRAGLTYVSCSPYRVPIAILAAAQSALINK